VSVHYRADGPIAVITIDRPEVAKIAMPVSWPSSPASESSGRAEMPPCCPPSPSRPRRHARCARGAAPGLAPPRAPGEPLEQAPRGVLGQLLERYGMEDVSGDLVVHGEHR